MLILAPDLAIVADRDAADLATAQGGAGSVDFSQITVAQILAFVNDD
jgi:hypothetical protein